MKHGQVTVVADAGGTKIDWRAVDVVSRAIVGAASTVGVSPLRDDVDAMAAVFGEAARTLGCRDCVSRLYYYGSGCVGGEPSEAVKAALCRSFAVSREAVDVESDMLGAARALCGREAGIACIVGTGSNSCAYDGRAIVANTPPLGYILGDEGSGAWLGRELLCGVLKGFLPPEVVELFHRDYPELTKAEVIRRVYGGAVAPNAFMASLARFYSRHSDIAALRETVSRGFGLFLDRNVAPYEGARTLPVNFTGSVACAFEPEMSRQLAERALTAGHFAPRPIERIAVFHTWMRSMPGTM